MKQEECIKVHVSGLCFKKINGKIYILAGRRRKTKKLYPGYWEFGGGSVCKGETFEEAVKREIWEEFKVVIKVLVPFATYYITVNGDKDLILGLRFICYCIDDSLLENEGEEHDIIKWIPIEEIDKYQFIPGLNEVARSAARQFEILLKKLEK